MEEFNEKVNNCMDECNKVIIEAKTKLKELDKWLAEYKKKCEKLENSFKACGY